MPIGNVRSRKPLLRQVCRFETQAKADAWHEAQSSASHLTVSAVYPSQGQWAFDVIWDRRATHVL
jgi:hypothetical protein